jgi:hypothetical protein
MCRVIRNLSSVFAARSSRPMRSGEGQTKHELSWPEQWLREEAK